MSRIEITEINPSQEMFEEIPSPTVVLDLDNLLKNYANQASSLTDIKALLGEIVTCIQIMSTEVKNLKTALKRVEERQTRLEDMLLPPVRRIAPDGLLGDHPFAFNGNIHQNTSYNVRVNRNPVPTTTFFNQPR